MPTLAEIQDWVIQQETEEPVESKSLDRVTKDIAVGIKGNNPLPQGHCNFCSRHSEALMPVIMKCCLRCCNQFIERGHDLKVLKVENGDSRCDSCLSRTFKTAQINPRICQYCTVTVGRTHRFELRDANKETAIIKKRRMERGVVI